MIEEEAITAVLEGKIDFLRQINLRPFINDAGLLSLACAKGHLEMVKLLLNVDGIDVNKNNPLCRACDRGHLKIVELLLNVDGIDVNQSYPPLCIACEKGHLEIVQLLLACDGIDVNKNSPLSIACSKGYAEIVELFVNINGVDWKKNLLQIAGGKDYLSITKLLVGQPKQATDDKIKIYKEKVSAKERFKKLKRINVNNLRRLRENADTIKTLKQKNERLEKHITDYTRFPLIKQVRISKSSQSIYALKKELNRIEKEISEISTCGKIVEPTDLNQLIEERNNIIDLIIQNYSGKLNEFQKEKEELLDMVKSMESSIRENETYIEYFQNINKLKLKKKDLLKSLTEIKEEIEDIELEKDEISLEIKKQRKNKIANMQDSIERLEKKLSNMGEKISSLNSKKSTIQQELMELIPSFPEIILEMEQTLTGDGTVSTIQEKFRMFALQNSILLLNTKFSDYNIIETVHTGLSDIYKAKKCNNQVVILKEVSLSQSTCDTIMNEIMNIVRLKGHSRIIKLNGVFIESQFNKVFIKTPYYSNGNLLDYITKIRNHHDLPTLKNILRSLFRKITETLQFIHSKDILHRDLKPHNILVNENGEPIIADFGSSKKLITQLTNNTMGVGTLKYMAPEVKGQEEAPSEKSDIWALGVSLFECWKLISNSLENNNLVEILNFDMYGNVVLPTNNLNDDIDILLMKTLRFIFDINPRNRPTALTLLTDEDYFTHECSISEDVFSKSNQKELERCEKILLWQARLKRLKQLVLLLPEHKGGEIKFEINRHNLIKDISLIVEKTTKRNNKFLIFYQTFVKYKGETGIDQGGLSNELFSKYFESMLKTKHFQNSETSPNENFILTDEPLTYESRIQLRTFGWLLKKMLIDCDDKTIYLPLNSFIFYYLLNGNNLIKKETLQLNAISLLLSRFLREYDFELQYNIMSLSKCKNDEELQSITMEETFFDVLSKSEKPLIMENIQLFIISQLFSYFYSDLRIEKLILIKEGFDWFNLQDFKKSIMPYLSNYDSDDENTSETACHFQIVRHFETSRIKFR